MYQIESGCSLLEVGITAGIYSATVLFLELPTGNLADLISRKIVYLIALVFFLLSGFVFLYSNTVVHFGIGFFLFGVFRAMASGSIEAWFIDELHIINKSINLQKHIAITNSYALSGGILGSIFCGIIPITLGAFMQFKFAMSLYTGNFVILISVCFFLLFFVHFFIFETPIKQERKNNKSGILIQSISDTLKMGFKNKIILILLLAMFAWGFTFSGIEFFWQPKIKLLMSSDFKIWILSVVSTLYYIFGLLGNNVITKICLLFKNDYAKILFYIRLLFGLILLILGFQESLILFIVLFVFLNMLASMHNSPHKSLLNEQVDREMRSSILSLESLFMEIGGLLGVLAIGFIAEIYSIKMGWIVGALIFIISGFLYTSIKKIKR